MRAFQGYYCNICKKDITKAEFFYSIDKFDRALCREHQELERRTRERSFRIERQEGSIVKQEQGETNTEEIIDSDEINIDGAPKSGRKSLGKKIAVKLGKGIVKGVKKATDSSRKRSKATRVFSMRSRRSGSSPRGPRG